MKIFLKSIIVISVTAAVLLPSSYAAKYQVIESPTSTIHKYTYGKQQNNQGDFLISATDSYNLPIQFQYLTSTDFDSIKAYAAANYLNSTVLTDLQDFNALKAGTPTANDLQWAILYLKSTYQNSPLYQKFYDTHVVLDHAGSLQDINIFDQPFTDGQLTHSTVDFANGITNDGWIYGNASAPSLPTNFTKSDNTVVTYWLQDFFTRGYVTTDQGATIHPVMPIETRFGGQSAVLGMNDQMQGVGFVSTGIDASALAAIDNTTGGCSDPAILKDVPFAACVWNYRSNLFKLSSVLWQFDSNGEVTSTTLLGDLINSVNVNDTRTYKSYALAVNNNGVAVGFANGWFYNNVTDPKVNEPRSFYAVIYKNGQVIDITPDHMKQYDSKLYDINNQGIAVGQVNEYINGYQRTKFFYIDTKVDKPVMVFPKDFFSGSSSTARAINNNGLVVGEGEVETHSDQSTTGVANSRRRHAFLYNLNDDSFTDLNALLSCSSPYSIVEARGINDNDEISATALMSVPRHDAKGAIVLDANGNQIMDDITKAVVLKPVAGGSVDSCGTGNSKLVRKGAGFFWLFLPLIGMLFYRRAKQN